MNEQLVKLATAPVLGLLFCMFLPFIGITFTAYVLGKLLFKKIEPSIKGVVAFGWRPQEAYLLGRNPQKKEGTKANQPPSKPTKD